APVNSPTPPESIPLDGDARVEGAAGHVTLRWYTFGDVTEGFIADMGAPNQRLAADPGLVKSMGWTLTQVAEGLAKAGQRFSFYSDERPGHQDHLVTFVAAEAGLEVSDRFLQ